MESIVVNNTLCDGCLNCSNMCESIHKSSRIKIIEHDSSTLYVTDVLTVQTCVNPSISLAE